MIEKSNGLNYYKMLIDDITENRINALKLGLNFRNDYSTVTLGFVYDIDEHTLIPIKDYDAYIKFFSVNMSKCPYPIVSLRLQIEDFHKESIKKLLIDNILYHEKQMLANEEDELISSAKDMSPRGLVFEFSTQNILDVIQHNINEGLFRELSRHDDLFEFFFTEVYEKALKNKFDKTLNSFFENSDEPFISIAKIDNILAKLFYLSIASLKRGKIDSDVATNQIVSLFNICNDKAAYNDDIVDRSKVLFLFLKKTSLDYFTKENINSLILTYQAIERKNLEK